MAITKIGIDLVNGHFSIRQDTQDAPVVISAGDDAAAKKYGLTALAKKYWTAAIRKRVADEQAARDAEDAARDQLAADAKAALEQLAADQEAAAVQADADFQQTVADEVAKQLDERGV